MTYFITYMVGGETYQTEKYTYTDNSTALAHGLEFKAKYGNAMVHIDLINGLN